MSTPALAPDTARPRIHELLPHRYPMLLVDRVLQLRPGASVRALKAVTRNEPWYQGLDDADDADAAYPSSLLIESWGQAAGLLAAADPAAAGGVMLFGSAAGATFHAPVHPGDVVEHRVRISHALPDTVIFEGTSHRGRDGRDGQDGRDGRELVLSVERMVMAFRPADALRPAGAGGTGDGRGAP